MNMEKRNSDFKTFYESLHNKHRIFYMFFTSGMLFWASKAISYIPQKTNLVLICAGLDEDEIEWLRNNMKRPIHFIKSYTNDKAIFRMLFDVNKYSFGWIDCDCFIVNPAVIDEMEKLDEKTSINVCWATMDKQVDRLLLNTYFLFININALNRLKELSIHVSPGLYVYPETRINDSEYPDKPEVLTPQLLQYLQEYNGKYPSKFNQDGDDGFFDTLLMFQLVTSGLGFNIKRVRELSPNNYTSDELFHVGGSSNFAITIDNKTSNQSIISQYEFNENMFNMIAYLILTEQALHLPKKYKILQRLYKKMFDMNGQSYDKILQEVVHMLEKCNVSREAINKVF